MIFDLYFLSYLWIFWLILLVIFLVAEGMSANFVTIWLAVGSLAGLMAERFLLPFIAQCLVFAAVSLLCIILLRPFCTRVLHSKTQPTNIAALIGKRAVALCDLNSFDVGEAKIGSRIWSAIAIEGSAIVAGNYGIIREIQGVKLVLEPAEPVAGDTDTIGSFDAPEKI